MSLVFYFAYFAYYVLSNYLLIPFSPIAPGETWKFSTTYTAALSRATYVLTINGATGLSNSSYCYIFAGAGSSHGYFSGTTNKTSTMYSDGTQVGLLFQIY